MRPPHDSIVLETCRAGQSTFENDVVVLVLDSSQSERGHEDYNPSDCQTANEARLEIGYYVQTRMRVPILI